MAASGCVKSTITRGRTRLMIVFEVAADRDQAAAAGQIQVLLAGPRVDTARQVEGPAPAPGAR